MFSCALRSHFECTRIPFGIIQMAWGAKDFHAHLTISWVTPGAVGEFGCHHEVSMHFSRSDHGSD